MYTKIMKKKIEAEAVCVSARPLGATIEVSVIAAGEQKNG